LQQRVRWVSLILEERDQQPMCMFVCVRVCFLCVRACALGLANLEGEGPEACVMFTHLNEPKNAVPTFGQNCNQNCRKKP
jgi:hypothetical protein